MVFIHFSVYYIFKTPGVLSPFRGGDCVPQWPGQLCWLEFLYSC